MKDWIKQVREELRSASDRDGYPELTDRILKHLGESTTPFSDASLVMSFGALSFHTTGENYVLARIMADELLRLKLIDHALIDPVPIVTKSTREFTRALSASQSLEYNDALFDRLLSFESAKKTAFRLSGLLSTHTVSPEKLEAVVFGRHVRGQIASDRLEALGAAYFALDLLQDSDCATVRLHALLMDVLLQHFPPKGNERDTLAAWETVKGPRILSQEEKFHAYSFYHHFSKSYEFDLSGLAVLSLDKAQRWYAAHCASPEALAQMTISEAHLGLGRKLVAAGGHLRAYTHALTQEQMLEASLSQDLGL